MERITEPEVLLFSLFSGAAVVFSLLAITRRQPIFGVLYLFVVGLSVAGLFALKKAFFLGLIQIIVYVGAVLVLFVFVIAMMNLKIEELRFGRFARWRIFVVLPVATLFLIIFSVIFSEIAILKEQKFFFFPAKLVGEKLYKDLIFHFEYISVFLLIAIVVTIAIGMRFKEKE
jgi:NADH-quinone oxidoreductase subunit J